MLQVERNVQMSSNQPHGHLKKSSQLQLTLLRIYFFFLNLLITSLVSEGEFGCNIASLCVVAGEKVV